VRLILASQSETRRRMLEAAGVPFEATAAQLDEEAAKAGLRGLSACQLAERLAGLKAISIAAGTDALVLGSDQTVERSDGAVLGKTADSGEARAQLLSLRGDTHRLHAAAVLVHRGERVWSATETVTMRVRAFSEAFLDDYLAREGDAVFWSAGGYRIEGLGAQLFEGVEGSHFAILGVPLLPLLEELRLRGVLTS
jgi:septum formation protein